MRLIVGAVACVLAGSAFAQPLESQVRSCRQIADNQQRLSCLDAIPISEVSEAAAGWRIEEGKSPLDDSPTVTATLPDNATQPSLVFVVRCKERTTEAFVAANEFLGSLNNMDAVYRIGSAPAIRANWTPSSSGRAAFFRQPITVLRAMPAEGRFFVRIRGSHGQAEGTFVLDGFEEVRQKTAAACQWPPQSSQSAAPRRPAP